MYIVGFHCTTFSPITSHCKFTVPNGGIFGICAWNGHIFRQITDAKYRRGKEKRKVQKAESKNQVTNIISWLAV